MSIECAECEHDLRGGHDESCSRYRWTPRDADRVECDSFGEGIVLYHDDEDWIARVRFDDVVAWVKYDDLRLVPNASSADKESE